MDRETLIVAAASVARLREMILADGRRIEALERALEDEAWHAGEGARVTWGGEGKVEYAQRIARLERVIDEEYDQLRDFLQEAGVERKET